MLLITHDIELALGVADRIAVFYAGTTVEEAEVEILQKRSCCAILTPKPCGGPCRQTAFLP